MTTPVTMHDDEITELARERFGAEPMLREYDGHYRECPGCLRIVHHSDRAHGGTCNALRAMVAWECNLPLEDDRDPQPARLPETTGGVC